MLEHSPKVSENMQKCYFSFSKNLIKFFGNTKLSLFSTKMISRYKVSRYNEGAKPSTINRELSMLSKSFNLAVNEWEWLEENVVSKVPKEKENKRDRWLSLDEEKSVLTVCPDWLSEIVLFALNTGLRKDELLSLEWYRVSLVRKTIIILDTKSGEPKTIPLNKVAFNLLNSKFSKKILRINGLVFVSRVGTKINPDNLRRAFNSALNKVSIENFTFHDLRHTFATRLAQSGIDIYKISKLLGHKDIRMTQRYSHHCTESLRDGVNILDDYYNPTTIQEISSLN